MKIKLHRFEWEIFKFILGPTHSDVRKILPFCLLNFLLGVGYSSGFFASGALLISRAGTKPLFLIYLESCLFSLLLVGIFYLLADRFPRKKVLQASFVFFGILITLCWFLLTSGSPGIGLYYSLRVLLYGIFSLSNLQYWILASDAYTNLEARRRFPTLVAAGVCGDFFGGLLASSLALRWGSVNLILIWAGILFLSPLLLSYLKQPEKRVRPADLSEKKKQVTLKSFDHKAYPRALLYALLLFWLAFSFFTYGVDYIFNTVALKTIGRQDLLSSFFGKVTLISSATVLIYQLFLAFPLTQRFGVDRQIYLLPFILVIGLGILCFFKTLWAVAVAEGLIFFFADFAAISLLQPILNLYPQAIRGRVKSLSEGIGTPAGILLLLLIGGVSSLFFSYFQFAYILFGLSLLFLTYPFFFKKAYVHHLRKLLYQTDYPLVSNAIQALGEPNMKEAVPELRQLLKHAERLDLKKTIILTLGKIQSREAFADIVSIFSVKDEALQIAALESLGSYKNYESMSALFRLMKSDQNVSFQVRINATFILTRLIGKKMIPFLLENLEDPDPRVQANAIESIGLLKNRKTISLLLPFLEHPSSRIRANTAAALFHFKSVRKEALLATEKLFQSENPNARLSALYAIGEMKAKNFQERLLRLLHVPDKKTMEHSAVALAKMKNPAFRIPLIQLLTDPDAKVGIEAARHIGRFPNFSRMILFEKIMNLDEKSRRLILKRLDQTPLDFTLEKTMLFEQDPYNPSQRMAPALFPMKFTLPGPQNS